MPASCRSAAFSGSELIPPACWRSNGLPNRRSRWWSQGWRRWCSALQPASSLPRRRPDEADGDARHRLVVARACQRGSPTSPAVRWSAGHCDRAGACRFEFDLFGKVGFTYAQRPVHSVPGGTPHRAFAIRLVAAARSRTIRCVRRRSASPVGRRLVMIYTIAAFYAGIAGALSTQRPRSPRSMYSRSTARPTFCWCW